MLFEALLGREQLSIGIGQPPGHVLDVEWRANAGDDVLALSVDEELAVELALARGGIACERHAGARVIPHVAEDHGDDVDRGAERLGDVVDAAIVDGLFEGPRLPHRFDRAPQLLYRVHRKAFPGPRAHERLVFLDEVTQYAFAELGVRLHTFEQSLSAQQALEVVTRDAEHDVAVHLKKTAIRVIREASVAALLREALHREIVQPQIEDRLHHSGHGHRRARSHGDEQGIVRLAELLPRASLELLEIPGNLIAERRWIRPIAQVGDARFA